MYIVVILIGISAPLSLVLSVEWFIDAAYAVAVVMIVLSCLCCILVLYIPKFYYLVKGAETMIPKVKIETFTPVDNLQLGRTDVNPDDLQHIDEEIEELKQKVKQKDVELIELQLRRGSDQDSGVLTSDEPVECSNPESPTTTVVVQTVGESSNPESQTSSDITTNNTGVKVESVITQQKLYQNSDENELSVDSARNEEEKKSGSDNREEDTECS